MSDRNHAWDRRKHDVLKRISEEHQKRAREGHGPYTANPLPPGDGEEAGNEWHSAADTAEFAAAGLCELWRMDFGDDTRFGRFADLPPAFNISGLWWRKA